ncbi:glutamate--cysteine ligase [Streptomyces sp. NPDC048269]|uniref:carboxylate-amine ligase n=1 Tax=Streptomyces sp. NPDC048269 TaxID=3155753 RepID=UPI00341DB8A8
MDVLTMGVEEEYLLVDRVGRTPVNRAPEVIGAVTGQLGDQVQAEFYNAQVEVCTQPTADRADLREQLARLRGTVARSASDAGCLLVASAVPVIAPQEPLTVTDCERYRRMARRFSSLVGPSRLVCGCHVHVGTLDRRRALNLSNHIRPWLPVFQSLTGNSPFSCGRDTGFDSWRSVAFSCWPTVGPPPLLDEPGYLEYVDGLIGSGVLLDRRMLYWYARPSEHVPTLEFRVSDVNADLDTVVLLAALIRGLAGTLLAEADAGVPPPQPATAMLRKAHELAAAHGIDGPGLDPVSGLEHPAVLLVERLLDRAAPGLDAAGDLYAVHSLWDGLRRQGTGASRQRAALERTGSLRGVVDSLAVSTATAAAPLAH